MATYDSSKYHIGLNTLGYIISHNRNGEKMYQKKVAPTFVSKYGGGDAAYRDATFWQYFVQTNWRNGSKQLKWDDPGKFWKSSDVDTTQLEELTLSKALTSVGQVASGVKVNALESWRSSTSWWDSNYAYRQQITVTNAATTTLPVGYPVKITIDTAALVTASKMQADRDDWRVVYFNGSSWVDLYRDYVAAAITFFALQNTISAGASDSNYYVYYGYAAESTSKQPTTDAGWNAVYGMFGVTPDTYSKGIYHFKEGSGTAVNDDTTNANNMTLSNTWTWATDGLFGRYAYPTTASTGYGSIPDSSDFDLGSMTIEAWIKAPTASSAGTIAVRECSDGSKDEAWQFYLANPKTLQFSTYAAGDSRTTLSYSWTSMVADTWYHVAATYDGSTARKIYVNGVEVASDDYSDSIEPQDREVFVLRNVNGSVGDGDLKIHHLRISNTARSSYPYAIAAASQPTTSAGTETTAQPTSSSFDEYAGCSDGKVYKWDGATTWTEQFDCHRIIWYETGNDANELVGDDGGTEKAKSQGFQVAKAVTVSGASFYLKKNAGTPGDITVTIETDSTNKPSGTKVHDNATGTITAFTTSTYGWVSVTFAGTFALTATTTYHIVLKTAAAANDNNYAWAADASSPGFTSGAQSYSTNGGSTWTADATKDQYFRLLSQSTSVNCMLVTAVGGTQKLYIGTGSPTSTTNGDARLYSYDGTTWALTYGFATATESVITSITEYAGNNKAYIGVGPQARVYETSDFSTITLSKDINVPQNPGYVYALKEYNSVLFAGGGSPEQLPSQYYNGFFFGYDTTVWRSIYPFDFTVIKSMEFYDAYLFIGTYRGDMYVYDTSTLTPLFNLKDQYNYAQEIKCMKYFDDKLYVGTYPQENSNDTNDGVWMFDRRGMSLAHTVSGVTGYRCMNVINGTLHIGTGDDGYVYKVDPNTYVTQGWYQSSYFDANLPSIDKLYNSVTVKHDPLLSGQSIVAYYKVKESDSWTTLGTSSTVDDTEETFTFASGTYSKKITLKVELNTTNTTASPKLTEVILQYSLYPARKWQWNLRLMAKKNLKLLDGTTESYTATQIRTALEGLMNSKTLYAYTDIDGTSYNVLVTDTDQTSWVVNKSDVNEDEVVLTLLEA